MVLSMLCCAGCEQPILDRFLYNVLDRAWHASCVRCADCQCMLSEKCFSREGKIFCREDFFRRFGTKCCGCSQGISPNDLVRRARDKVFHLKCFTCVVCRKQLSTGEQLYVVGETTFVCKEDYLKQMNDYSFFSSEDEDDDSFQDKLILDEAVTSPALRPPSIGSTNSPSVDTKPPVGADCYVSGAESVTSVDSEVKDNQSETKPKIDSDSKGDKASGDCDVLDEGHGNGKRRGPRTTIKAKQLEILKSAFAATPKPTRHIREQLAKETGLNMRVIQVWFQNKRSKERRMKQLSSLNARRSFFRQVGGPRRMRPLQPGMCDIEEGSGFPYFPDGGPPGDFGYGNQPYYEFFPNSRGGDMFPPPQGGPVPLEPPHGGPMYHPMGAEAPFMPPNDIPSRSSPEMQGMARRTGGGDGGPFPPHNPNMMRETAVW